MNLPGMPSFGAYDLIVSDPPWPYERPEAPGGMGDHYDGMSHEDMAQMPVGALGDPRGCALVMWSTGPMTAEGRHVDLGRAWGFRPVTLLFEWLKVCEGCAVCGHAWASHAVPRAPHEAPGPCMKQMSLCKHRPNGVCACDGFVLRPDPGCGSYTMSCTEQAFLFLRGDVRWSSKRALRNVRQLIVAPVAQHSAKPEAMQDHLEAMWPWAKRRLELFARRKRPGWDAWGNQVPNPTLVFGADVGTHWPGSVAQPEPRGEARAVQHGLGAEDPAAGLDKGLPWWAP